MLIFGLHRIFIGIIDFILEKNLHISDIIYNWYECTILTLVIEMAFIPIIYFAINNCSILLGKKKQSI
jgi:hypothetical protein